MIFFIYLFYICNLLIITENAPYGLFLGWS